MAEGLADPFLVVEEAADHRFGHADPLGAFLEIHAGVALVADGLLDADPGGAQDALALRAVLEVTREEVPALDLADDFRRHSREGVADEFLALVLLEEGVDVVLALERQIHAREEVVVGVGAVLQRGAEEGVFRLHDGVVAPAHVDAVAEHDQARLVGVQRGQFADLAVDVHEDVVARVVQTPDQGLEQRELVVREDEEGVFHPNFCLIVRTASKGRPSGVR